jgi:hypothetical protein
MDREPFDPENPTIDGADPTDPRRIVAVHSHKSRSLKSVAAPRLVVASSIRNDGVVLCESKSQGSPRSICCRLELR